MSDLWFRPRFQLYFKSEEQEVIAGIKRLDLIFMFGYIISIFGAFTGLMRQQPNAVRNRNMGLLFCHGLLIFEPCFLFHCAIWKKLAKEEMKSMKDFISQLKQEVS